MKELKPCPFCGSKMVAHGLFNDGEMMVKCMDCDSSGPTIWAVPDLGIITEYINKSIEAWNTRA